MADEIDLASDRQEIARAAAATHRRPEGPQATGRCHHCDEILDDVKRWCDQDCLSAWERERSQRSSLGRRA